MGTQLTERCKEMAEYIMFALTGFVIGYVIGLMHHEDKK